MGLLRFMVRVFFRRVTVTGLDKIFNFTEDVATSIASLQIEAE